MQLREAKVITGGKYYSRAMRYRGEGRGARGKGVEEGGVRGACREHDVEGTVGTRFILTTSAEAFAMMCPTLFLRLLKKAARSEKAES